MNRFLPHKNIEAASKVTVMHLFYLALKDIQIKIKVNMKKIINFKSITH